MKKKAATKAERDHMSAVAELGCIACYNEGHSDTPACIHHIDRSRNHWRVLPLCPRHHSVQHGGVGEAIHAGRLSWVSNHGLEQELLEQVNGMLDS